MNKDNIIYWVSTGIIGAMMLMSAVMYFTNEEAKQGFAAFPPFFRIELGVAKILGVIALVLPMVPNKIKDFAYAGFTITFISAFLLHLSIGDPITKAIIPLVVLGGLAVSYIYKEKIMA